MKMGEWAVEMGRNGKKWEEMGKWAGKMRNRGMKWAGNWEKDKIIRFCDTRIWHYTRPYQATILACRCQR